MEMALANITITYFTCQAKINKKLNIFFIIFLETILGKMVESDLRANCPFYLLMLQPPLGLQELLLTAL